MNGQRRRIAGPCTNIAIGNGRIGTEAAARRVPPQPQPSVFHIDGAASGSVAPRTLRSKLAAATAAAAYGIEASTEESAGGELTFAHR